MIQTVEIVEGSTPLVVPAEHSDGGPGKITGGVFFNGKMAFNRDVSVMFLRALGGVSAVDAMSATGARAVRLANEVPGCEVVANDSSRLAHGFISRNIELNSLTNCRASNKDLRVLLAEESFGYVDIDPFGSPMPFLHAAIGGCAKGGVLAVTATDTAPLAGAHRKKCERRYGSRPIRGAMCHEGGLRILLSSLARELAKFDRGMMPLLCHSSDHYYRVYVRVTDTASHADETLSKLIYMGVDPDTRQRLVSNALSKETPHGPFWGGRLFDDSILGRLDPKGVEEGRRCEKSIALWKSELDRIPYVYCADEMSSHAGVGSPRFADLLDRLSEIGPVSPTHISPTSFRTEIPATEIVAVLRSM
ncbi:MAG: N2,N2-dimethylguanosine tRNA methyltransferase [Thermoplasmatales archaeon]|mgnify:CR=1 FL=1|nr:N2,N2-dimethylguanosine tRNA methyltransferase [Thermoplasmatales archaeon]